MMGLLPFVSVVLGILVWLLTYERTTFMPAPLEVWATARATLGEPDTYVQIFLSLRRLVAGLVIGFAVGFLLSIQAARSRFLERMVTTYVRITFTIPSLLLALVSLVVFGVSDVGAIVVVAVIIFPFVTGPLMHGAKSLDRAHMQMADVYRASIPQVVRHIAIPHMAPYLFSALRNAHAQGWKVLIVAELFAVRSGIGNEFNRAFSQFDLPLVMVWLAIFLAAIAFIEYGVLAVLERRVFRWRPNA